MHRQTLQATLAIALQWANKRKYGAEVWVRWREICDDVMRIREQHPHLNIDLILNDQIVDPVTEGVDISLRLGQLGEGSFIARPLGHVRRVLVASPAYLKQHGSPDQPGDLVAHPFIRVMGLFGDRVLRLIDGTQSLMTAPISTAVSVSHWRPVYELLLAGAGIGVLQEPVCAPALASGSLIRLLPRYTVPGFDLNALCARPIPSKTRALLALLEKELPAALGSFSGDDVDSDQLAEH
jgi:DNA-binding transcriptional LysR family regulator